MNDFKKDLEYSHSCEDDPCWLEIYRKAFPTMTDIISHRQDGWHQRAGVDRSVILANSKQILVDEKARRIKNTGDIMLEYISNDRANTPGWVEKSLKCDYIAYAFMPSGIAFLLPVNQLQTAWLKNKIGWLRKYKTRAAINDSYKTLNCPVPINELYQAIGQCLRIRFEPRREE